MAKALAKEYAKNGYHLILAGRKIQELSDFSNALKSDHAITVQLIHFDALELNTHASFVNELTIKPYGVICCVGYLGSQESAVNNSVESVRIINTNYVGCVSILNYCAQYLEQVQKGFIIGISSVAGERGRKSNYFYGSAKAGFTAYLSGLRARLYSESVHVMTVTPGFVYTNMTKHLDLPKVLSIHPEPLAKKIFKAQQKKKNVVYFKWIWKYIMWIIRMLPEFIFKRTNL